MSEALLTEIATVCVPVEGDSNLKPWRNPAPPPPVSSFVGVAVIDVPPYVALAVIPESVLLPTATPR